MINFITVVDINLANIAIINRKQASYFLKYFCKILVLNVWLIKYLLWWSFFLDANFIMYITNQKSFFKKNKTTKSKIFFLKVKILNLIKNWIKNWKVWAGKLLWKVKNLLIQIQLKEKTWSFRKGFREMKVENWSYFFVFFCKNFCELIFFLLNYFDSHYFNVFFV